MVRVVTIDDTYNNKKLEEFFDKKEDKCESSDTCNKGSLLEKPKIINTDKDLVKDIKEVENVNDSICRL
jgi:hypothetical protein